MAIKQSALKCPTAMYLLVSQLAGLGGVSSQALNRCGTQMESHLRRQPLHVTGKLHHLKSVHTWAGAKNRRILLAIQFFDFLIFFLVILAVCFPKLAFGTSKIEILRSKSVWGQIFMQIRPKFNDFLAIYEFVMIFSRMARCLVFVDPIFCPPPCTQMGIATKENCLMGISIQKSMTKIYPS